MNWHKRPTDVWRQLESRHAPKTMGEMSMLLMKYVQYKFAPTSDPMLDIAALSDIRAYFQCGKSPSQIKCFVSVFWTPYLARTSMKFDGFNLR